ncbi:MAG: hypothetical protein LUI87_13470, partial [Lachnospiraceae bacterium]|nr:hypothetical protein [Lachnospiraceae bacterium]
SQKFTLTLQNKGGRHYVELGKDPTGNITRINHTLTSIGEKLLPEAEQKLENLRQQMQNAQEELKKPFPKEQELAEKSARLAELNALLNMDKKDSMDAVGVGEKTALAETIPPSGKNQPATAGAIPGRDEMGQSSDWQTNQGRQRWQGNPESHSNPNSYSNSSSYSNSDRQPGQSSPYGQNQEQSRFRNTKPKTYSYR